MDLKNRKKPARAVISRRNASINVFDQRDAKARAQTGGKAGKLAGTAFYGNVILRACIKTFSF